MKRKIITAVIAILLIGATVTGTLFALNSIMIKKYKSAKAELPEGFTITAHTGCEGTEENSMDFLLKAVALDVEIVEFDVGFDENDVPVLAHDEPVGGEVTLREAFEIIKKNPHISVNVDIKATDNLTAIESLAKEIGVLEQIFLTGVKEEFLSAVQQQTKDIPYYLNVNVDRSKATDTEYLEEICTKVRQSGAVGINFSYKRATKELVDYFHNQGLLVSIWTVDREVFMHKILSFAPDNITTRHPLKLREIISQR